MSKEEILNEKGFLETILEDIESLLKDKTYLTDIQINDLINKKAIIKLKLLRNSISLINK